MLYIFHVDTGRMMTFDMNLALESVQFLKETIERHHTIPAASQVLLVSGGEMLQTNARVCSYSAGTDTNPIYMFNTIDSQNPPKPWPSIDADTDLKEKIDSCLELPANYNTVVIRAQLAQQCYEMAKEENKICEKLVHEQHLQQQGWSAVVANMEDITDEFKERCCDFYGSFDEHLKHRKEYLEFVTLFNSDLDNLARIPILPGLMHCAEERPFHAFDDFLNDSETFTKSDTALESSHGSSHGNSREPTPDTFKQNADSSEKKVKQLSLLQWISASENQKSLKHLAHNCSRSLELFDEKAMDTLKLEAQKAIDAAQQENIKEIKGLEDRLCGLEKLMFDAKKIVQEQCELAQAFQQNQIRANNLGDASILPDLCASHCNQLVVMSENHKRLRDIRRRVTKAKEELATNLNKRLKYVVYIENRMYDIDNSLLFYHRCLRRLQRHLGIIEQIHKAPCMYVTAVTEVVRRRVFSSAFLMWASNLACQLLTIYNDEVMRRHDFSSIFDGHFLSTLFPGMNDMPPTYATEAPSIFDSSLPQLNKDDISVLSTHLPEITSKIELPDLSAVIDFFSSRSGTLKSKDEKNTIFDNRPNRDSGCGGVDGDGSGSGDGSGEQDRDIIIPKPIVIHSHLKDYERGFESETDTEEFEKVGQSPIERHHRTTISPVGLASTTISGHTQTSFQTAQTLRPDTCNTSTSTENIATHSIETLTEDNLGSTRLEVEKLRNLLKVMGKLSQDTLNLLKNQLNEIKDKRVNEKSSLEIELNKLKHAWEQIEKETQLRDREVIQQMTLDHELELNDVKQNLTCKNEEIENLRNEKNVMIESYSAQLTHYETDNDLLKRSLGELKSQIKLLEEKVASSSTDKEKAVNEVKDQLIHSHKTEIESLRCRFKLMTSMERSPSDTSLEKIERPEYIELSNHESILLQTKEDMQLEKELAIKSAIDRERARFDSRTSSQIALSTSPKSPTSNPDLYRRILEEKERQIDVLRDRETHLSKENLRLKETIQSLADSEPSCDNEMLKSENDNLLRNKVKLEQDLEMERSLRKVAEKMTTSRCEFKSRDVATSPDPNSYSPLMHHNRSITKYIINFESCTRGDTVLVVWNSAHSQYTIVQESQILYFLHGESYKCLDLAPPNPPGTAPAVIYCIGTVIDKEYCHARKNENRYRVSKGTKFYRVKVIPRKSDTKNNQRKEKQLDNACTSSSSESVSRSTSTEYNQQFQFIDSFAQTELLDPVLEDPQGKDMIDSGVVTQQKSIYKERNISITEEDDAITTENRCRYVSVSEEEELSQDVNKSEEDIDDGDHMIHCHPISSSTVFKKIQPSEDDENDIGDDSDEFRSLETID